MKLSTNQAGEERKNKMSQPSLKRQLAMQLHHDYYISLHLLGELEPEQEPEYDLAIVREKLGVVTPLTLEDQIRFITSKVTDEVTAQSSESVFIEGWGTFYRRGDGWHSKECGFFGPSTPMAKRCEEASKNQSTNQDK